MKCSTGFIDPTDHYESIIVFQIMLAPSMRSDDVYVVKVCFGASQPSVTPLHSCIAPSLCANGAAVICCCIFGIAICGSVLLLP